MRLKDFQKWAYEEANHHGGVFPKEVTLSEDSALELAGDLADIEMLLDWQGRRTWGKHHPYEILDSMKNGTARLLDIAIVVRDQ